MSDEKEILRLAGELANVRDERDRYRCELTTLRDHLDTIESENRKYADLFQEIEQQSSNLASLYVSSYQLHSTVVRDEVLGRILEIVINLIGSEEVGIFESGDAGEVYTLSASMGIDGDCFAKVSAADAHLGTRIVAGETFVAPNGSGEPLTACIPLKIEDKVIGAIVIFRLLAHKSALEPLDFELMELLATHAATSLHCANLHGRIVTAVAS